MVTRGNDFLEVNDIVPNGNPLDIDLNMAVDDDLGGIENLIQAAEDLEAQVNEEEVQIIDATNSSDSSMANGPA